MEEEKKEEGVNLEVQEEETEEWESVEEEMEVEKMEEVEEEGREGCGGRVGGDGGGGRGGGGCFVAVRSFNSVGACSTSSCSTLSFNDGPISFSTTAIRIGKSRYVWGTARLATISHQVPESSHD